MKYLLMIMFILMPFQAYASYQGLWIGQVEINKVNEVNNPTDTSVPKKAPHPFDLTVLLHVDTDNNVRILRDAIIMQKTIVENEEEVSKRVIITNDNLLSNYEGVIRRDGKLVGIRMGSLGFDFEADKHQLMLTGQMAPGNTLQGSIAMGENHPTNPFKHLYHPDHQKGRAITRNVSFTIDSEQDANDPDSEKFSLTGQFEESVTGLHKIPIVASGIFTIKRISVVGELNDGQ